MKKPGRPLGSDVRDHIAEILFFLGSGYAYQIAKIYEALYRKVTMRVIYYHLRKGVATGEFIIKEVRKEKGNWSWGGEVERTYYALGKAKPLGDPKVKEYLEKKST